MTQQTSSRSLKAIMGAALAAVGLLLLFVNLDNATAGISRSFSSPAESLGAAFELGLAGMRAAQTYFFDHHRFQSGVYQLLISFWPVALVFFGAALLQNAVASRLANGKGGLRPHAEGVHE
jgi:hypothetical protein